MTGRFDGPAANSRPTSQITLSRTPIARCAATGLPCLCGPGQLVALGFRHWMLGYITGDDRHWSACWSLYEQRVGSRAALQIAGDLSGYARSIARTSRRQITLLPPASCGFGPDECAVAGLIAATQHHACPALKACAAALLANDACDGVLTTADALSHSLLEAGQMLPPELIDFAWPHHDAVQSRQ